MSRVCNLDRLKAISLGDDEFAEELVRVFLDDAAEQIENLREAVRSGDCVAASEAAHRLKGAGGNVGAELFAQACQRLETAARDQAADALAPVFRDVDRELARVRSTFEAELGVR